MRPPACVSCKWGTGTTSEKPTTTGSSKELEAKLKEMMAERTQQDAKWFAPPRLQDDHITLSTSSLETPQNKRK